MVVDIPVQSNTSNLKYYFVQFMSNYWGFIWKNHLSQEVWLNFQGLFLQNWFVVKSIMAMKVQCQCGSNFQDLSCNRCSNIVMLYNICNAELTHGAWPLLHFMCWVRPNCWYKGWSHEGNRRQTLVSTCSLSVGGQRPHQIWFRLQVMRI